MSVDLKKNLNLSALDIKPYTNYKLQLPKTDKQKRYNNISSYSLKFKKENVHNKMKKGLSAFLFQNNEVDLVRSLNPDSEKDLCENLLFKENLINNIENNDNFDMPEQYIGQKILLPKIKRLTINGILESEKKLNRNKKEAAKNLANNLLEKELYNDLKNIRNKYSTIKIKKKELFIKFENIMREIDSTNLDLHILELKHTDNYLSKIFEFRTKELETKRIQREKMENGNKFNNKVMNTLSEKVPNLIEGLDMNIINKQMNNNINENNIDSKNSNHNSENKSQFEDKMKKMKMLYLAKKEQEELKLEKYQTIKNYKNLIKKIEDEINSLNKELTELREQEHNIVQKLMKHFQALLFNGRDTRNEGLVWIIKAMWSLGKNVPMQFIPTFLDFKSIEFLFKLANKSIELDNKKKLLNEQKKELNIKLHRLYYFKDNNKKEKNVFNKKLISKKNLNYKRKSSLIFKTNLIKKNSVLKNSISDSIFVKSYLHSNVDEEEENENEPNTFKEISKVICNNNKNYEIEQLSEMKSIENLQKNIRDVEKEIENLKKEEIKRIFKEFIANDYRNRYHVSVDIVLSALLGEHTKNIEINKYAKYEREYIESIKNLRFFEYGKHKDSN